jgi:dihydrofolate reductase
LFFSSYDSWDIKPPSHIIVISSFEKALQLCYDKYHNSKVYVIGGNKLYKESLKHSNLESIIVSIIPEKYFKDNITPNIYFPITFEDMNNKVNIYLLYCQNDINTNKFKS